MDQDQPRFCFKPGFYNNIHLVPFPGGNVVKNLLKEAQPVESVLQTIGDVGFPS
jgi:hypothetical protein